MKALACVALLVAAAVPSRAGDLAAHDYVLHCGGCHGLDGAGSANVPSLAGSGELLGSEAGRDYLVRVPGVAQAPLDDARLAGLLNHVLLVFGGRSPTPPFAAGEVAVARGRPLLDPQRARNEALGHPGGGSVLR